MERMDINEFLDDAFATELIAKTERRIQKRKQIRQICMVLVVLLVTIGVFGREEITSAAENTIFYLFGRSGQDNIEDTAFYTLQNPIVIGDKLANQIQVEYAFLIDNELTMRLQMNPGHWEDVDKMALKCGEQRCAIPQTRAKATVLGDGHSLSDSNGYEDKGDIFVMYEAYDQDEATLNVTFSRVNSRELTIEYAGVDYALPLVPAKGYGKDSIFTAETDTYKATAVLLDRERAAFGIHIDTLERFRNWNVYLNDVYFIDEDGKRLDSTYYYDTQSYMPIEKAKPKQLYIGGVRLDIWGDGMQDKEDNRYRIRVPEQGETVTLNQKIQVEGADATLQEVTRTKDQLQLRFSCDTNYGMLSNIILASQQEDRFGLWENQGDYYSATGSRTYSDLAYVQEGDSPSFYVNISIGQKDEELLPEQLENGELELQVISLSIDLREPVTIEIPDGSFEKTTN